MREEKYIPSKQVQEQLVRTYTYRVPQDDQAERYVEIRARAGALGKFLTAQCPPSRELSLALTQLEQVVMYANAAIARHEPLENVAGQGPSTEPRQAEPTKPALSNSVHVTLDASTALQALRESLGSLEFRTSVEAVVREVVEDKWKEAPLPVPPLLQVSKELEQHDTTGAFTPTSLDQTIPEPETTTAEDLPKMSDHVKFEVGDVTQTEDEEGKAEYLEVVELMPDGEPAWKPITAKQYAARVKKPNAAKE